MVTLFDQSGKYYNQNNKILHLVSHVTFHTWSSLAAPLIGPTEPSNYVPGSSDWHA